MSKSEQGLVEHAYTVIPRTLIFIFNTNQEVLLIKGSTHKERWQNVYNGVGGHIEAGEDILTAANRELAEETGIHELPINLCGQIMIDVFDHQGVALFVFKGHYEDQTIQPSNEGELYWVPMEEIENLPLVDDLPVLLPMVYAYNAGEPIIIGKYFYNNDGKLLTKFVG
jgi:8-oxo-dGTP diphosphatase